MIVTHDPSLALSADKRIVLKNGGIVKIFKNTLREKGVAYYLNWIEGHSLDIREKIRQGKRVKKAEMFCELKKFKK